MYVNDKPKYFLTELHGWGEGEPLQIPAGTLNETNGKRERESNIIGASSFSSQPGHARAACVYCEPGWFPDGISPRKRDLFCCCRRYDIWDVSKKGQTEKYMFMCTFFHRRQVNCFFVLLSYNFNIRIVGQILNVRMQHKSWYVHVHYIGYLMIWS